MKAGICARQPLPDKNYRSRLEILTQVYWSRTTNWILVRKIDLGMALHMSCVIFCRGGSAGCEIGRRGPSQLSPEGGGLVDQCPYEAPLATQASFCVCVLASRSDIMKGHANASTRCYFWSAYQTVQPFKDAASAVIVDPMNGSGISGWGKNTRHAYQILILKWDLILGYLQPLNNSCIHAH